MAGCHTSWPRPPWPPWAGDAEILLVGFDTSTGEDFESLAPDRVTVVSDLEPALSRMLTRHVLAAAAAGDRLTARVHASARDAQDDVQGPLLLVIADVPSAISAEQLDALPPAESRGAITVIAPGPWTAQATWRLAGQLPVPGDQPAPPQPSLLDADQLHRLADSHPLG